MNLLNDVVEKFVVVESNLTHSGKPKTMYFTENISRFDKFRDKIIHLVYQGYEVEDDKRDTHIVWYNENTQRNTIVECLKIAQPSDGILFISDVDEIVKPEKMLEGKKMYIESGSLINFGLEQCLYYMNYNFKGFKQIRGSMMYNPDRAKAIYEMLGRTDYSISTIRWHMVAEGTETHWPTVWDAGWHFSTLGDPSLIRYKLESNAHRFCDTEEYKNVDRINQCITEGTHVYDVDRYKDTKLVKRELSFLPKYVLDNLQKYSKYVLFD
jgi:beta-1,4-mannosyl-glycoprotein beta-1,4-N-acetylglucosaminyltransferase